MTALAVWGLLGWLGLSVIAGSWALCLVAAVVAALCGGRFAGRIERAHRGHW